MLPVCFNQDQETTVYQDESKLKDLQTSVRKIAALSIMVHIIVFISFLFPHEQKGSDSYWSFEEEINRLSETPNFIGAWIWIITLSACISLYIGANKKRRSYLLPFMVLFGILQASFVVYIVLAIISFFAAGMISISLPPFFIVAVMIVSLIGQRSTKNLFIELGRQPPCVQPNVSYNPGFEQLYSGIYQPGVTNQVQPNDPTCASRRDCEISGFHVNMLTSNVNNQIPTVGHSLSLQDRPPAYFETQNSNICINVEPPPSYNDAIRKSEDV